MFGTSVHLPYSNLHRVTLGSNFSPYIFLLHGKSRFSPLFSCSMASPHAIAEIREGGREGKGSKNKKPPPPAI